MGRKVFEVKDKRPDYRLSVARYMVSKHGLRVTSGRSVSVSRLEYSRGTFEYSRSKNCKEFARVSVSQVTFLSLAKSCSLLYRIRFAGKVFNLSRKHGQMEFYYL